MKSKVKGFSLIELMVAAVVGLIAVLVITNVLMNYESQKRTTVGTGEAQINGAVALYQIQRDTQSAGYGLPVYGATSAGVMQSLNCPTTTNISVDLDHNAATPNVTIDISPVEVTNGDGWLSSDTLRIHLGDTSFGGVPAIMTTGATGNVAEVNNNMHCHVGDVAFVMKGASTNPSCQLSNVTAVSGAAVFPATITLSSNNLVGLNSQISCLGNWTELKYSVDNNGQLLKNDVPIMSGIVNMQVQYGVSSTGNSNDITSWVDATGNFDPLVITVQNRNRIKAVRVAVVARSAEVAQTDVTDACASNANGLCAWQDAVINGVTYAAPKVNLSTIANWKRYRYRVYETVIPLKNVVYSKQSEN